MGPRRRLALFAALVAVTFGVALWLLPHSTDGIRDLVDRAGPLAVVAALVLWCVATPALISIPLLSLATGLMFGPVAGSAIAVPGATLGALVAFAMARRLGGEGLGALGGRAARWTKAIESRGFRSMLCLRAAPLMPATIISYGAGLSRIGLFDFTAATLLFAAPRGIAFAMLGAAPGERSGLLVALPTVVLIVVGGVGIALVRGLIRDAREVGAAGLEPAVYRTRKVP
jgi:uncharacterized membrane protein YdjX (TVP38/TMEM64 family)